MARPGHVSVKFGEPLTVKGQDYVFIFIGVLALPCALAQDMGAAEKVHFQVADAFEPGAAVVGQLHVPVAKGGRLPAVMTSNER